jgi:hypothetical protein
MASERPIPYSEGDAEIHFEYKGRFYQVTKSWIFEQMQLGKELKPSPEEVRDREYKGEWAYNTKKDKCE